MTALAFTAAQTAAHPPDPAHGIDKAVFPALWSGDDDSAGAGDIIENGNTSVEALAAGTDIPFDSPPEAVDTWNRGDQGDFPETNQTTSTHPSNVTLHNGTFLKDAYIEVFSVQPSTRALLSPSFQPRYVAPNGSVLGIVDYRVDVPANVTTGERRVLWTLASHNITMSRLLVDNRTVARSEGSHTPALNYTQLGGAFGTRHELAIESDLIVQLKKRTGYCNQQNATGACTDWQGTVEFRNETMTVRDTIKVRSYTLVIGGFKARYPNGNLGLVVFKAQPWLGYSVPDGDVRGVWRFYSARDEAWDTLITRRAENRTNSTSPLHPLQVHAYPIETGPTASPRGKVSILETYGTQTSPPRLPADVHLDVLTEPYTMSYGIATRTKTTNHNLSAIEAQGLVRNVTARPNPDLFLEVPINRSELTLSIIGQTDQTVTVRARLEDATTGRPINTNTRTGYVVLAGRTVETSGNGTAVLTLDQPSSGIAARYEPGRWWINHPGYTADSDAVYVRGTILYLVRALFQMGIPIAMVLLCVFLIDRVTGWRVWPPWRRL